MSHGAEMSPTDITTGAASADRARASVCAVLQQLIDLLDGVSPEQYVRSPVGQVHSAIGPHLRHCLDHVEAFLTALITGRLDFDHRERGTAVERQVTAARAEARRLMAALRALDAESLDRPLDMTIQIAEDGSAVAVKTTALRELAYLLAHTIHHNALIGVMARTMGVPLPARFGYAPSTLSFLNRTGECAR